METKNKKKLIYISGTRADYFLMRKTLFKLDKIFDLLIVATSMHLSTMMGRTINNIISDGFKVKKVDMLFDNDNISAMPKSLGIGIFGITQIIEDFNPDIIFVEGDRGESLAASIIGAHMKIPVIHHGGGDISGSIDNKIRFSITFFSDYHLVSNKQSYERIKKLGINEKNIHIVGEPGIEDIENNEFLSAEKVRDLFHIKKEELVILLIQHPNTDEFDQSRSQILETLNAIKDLNLKTIAIYSNSDSGGRVINEELEKFSFNNPNFVLIKNLNRETFLGLMNVCSIMVGNSSSGIIELPSFKKPYVCIGSRQDSRLKPINVVDVPYNSSDIIQGIKKGLFDENFKQKLSLMTNPYGEGPISERIITFIKSLVEKKSILERITTKLNWDSILETEFSDKSDVYFSYNYHYLFKKHFNVEIEAIYWKDDVISIFLPRLKRKLDEIEEFKHLNLQDLTSAYGYVGPLIKTFSDDSNKINSSIQDFFSIYSETMKEKKVISEFIRFHPLYTAPELFVNQISIQMLNDVVIIDLKESLEKIWSKISDGQKYNIKKSMKSNISVNIIKDPSEKQINTFLKLYLETMNRNNATHKYFFSENFIKDHFTLLNCFFVNVDLEDVTLSSNLYLTSNKTVHYHLCGNQFNQKGIYPNAVAIWETIKWAKEYDFEFLQLGGGRGTNDELFNFKRSFSSKIKPFYVGKMIYDLKTYEYLNQLRSIPENNFFPLYRFGLNQSIV